MCAGRRGRNDRVGKQEDAYLLAVSFGERVRESQPVVRALAAVGRVVEDDEGLHSWIVRVTFPGCIRVRPVERLGKLLVFQLFK